MIWFAAALTLAGAWSPDLRVRLFFFAAALPFWAMGCLESWRKW